MKVWGVAVLVAWACSTCYCMVMSLSTNSVLASPVAAAVATENNDHHHQHHPNLKDGYSVKFNTKGATRDSYLRFMKDLFNALTEHGDRTGLIPVLPAEWSSLPTTSQYVYVELSNGVETVTLALNASNAYVLGYLAQDGRAYFFRDVPPEVRNTIFPDLTQVNSLPFGVQYDSLEAAAGVPDRREIPLGIVPLSAAIRNLYYGRPNHGDSASVARALIISIQMVAEAVRFRTIQRQLLDTVYGPYYYGVFSPTASTLELETSWGQLSAAVQSARTDVFGQPVTLTLEEGERRALSTVRQVLFLLALMPFVCRPTSYQPPLILPSAATAVRSALELDRRHFVGHDDTCEYFPDPTVHLLGRDGLCLDVYQADYHDGNKIILYPCWVPDQVNQLWTLMSDQTIRSNGKCLTAYGSTPGDYMMIYDCAIAKVEATKWEVLSDGTIRNPTSGLVLTARKDDTNADTFNIVVERNYYGARQAFAAAGINDIKPLATKIVGYRDLCIQTDGIEGDVIVLDICYSTSRDDEWLVYPDGTIRPYDNTNKCLKYEDFAPVINFGYCDGYVEERWLFQSDGTILHRATEQVIDVVDTTTPSWLYVTLRDPNPNQVTQVWFQLWL